MNTGGKARLCCMCLPGVIDKKVQPVQIVDLAQASVGIEEEEV